MEPTICGRLDRPDRSPHFVASLRLGLHWHYVFLPLNPHGHANPAIGPNPGTVLSWSLTLDFGKSGLQRLAKIRRRSMRFTIGSAPAQPMPIERLPRHTQI